MSVAKLQQVARARKSPGSCGKCRVVIETGQPYRYWRQWRSKFKSLRCMKSECSPRPSERESSLMADVLGAQEDFDVSGIDAPVIGADGTVEAQGFIDDIHSEIEHVTEAIDGVAEQYREQDNAFGGSGSTPGAERADTLEDASSTLGDYQPSNDEPEPCGEHDDKFGPECQACQEAVSTWADEIRDDATSAVNDIELP